ncbi:MAG: hypothetical protein ACLP3B_11160 [Syntrophobacteraceae bacterium]
MHDKKCYSPINAIVKCAADLLLKCAGYLADRNAALREDHCHTDTYYAIDTDVILLYLEPEVNVSYLDIFSEGESSSTSKSLAFLMGDFLFSSRSLLPGKKQNFRFLVISPHDEELLRVLSAIHRKLSSVHRTVDQEKFDDLSRIFDDYDKKIINDNSLLDELKKQVPALVELFNPYKGPRAALERYANLNKNTFQPIETYWEDGFQFPLLDPINNGEHRREFEKLSDDWERLLGDYKGAEKPDENVRTDAEVLAAIEYVNSKLWNKGKQVVLVTGSKYLFSAAAADRKKPPYVNGRTFGEMYLRHPQAFLAHPKFFSDSDAEAVHFGLRDWLNLGFPFALRNGLEPLGEVVPEVLHRILRGEYESLFKAVDKIGQPSEIPEGWKEQVASAAWNKYMKGLDKAEKRSDAEELWKKLTELRKRDWSVIKLRDLMFKESVGSISRLYSSTLWVGMWSQATRKQPKAVPVLRFEGPYSAIQNYCDQIVRMQLKNFGQPLAGKDITELGELSKQIEKKDDSLYHSHVVHALAFGAKGHWHAAMTLATTAIAISDNLDKSERDFRWGREAAYLACIASRRSATSISGIRNARRYLGEARRRDKKNGPEDIRFRAEDAILDTKAYYFDYFCDSNDPKTNDIIDTMQTLYRLIDESENEKNDKIKLWVQRQILTHLFVLFVISYHFKVIKYISDSIDFTHCLEVFHSILTNEYSTSYLMPHDDPFAHLIYDIANAIWSPNNDKQVSTISTLSKKLEDWQNFFMPYDKGRLRFLKDVIRGERAKT